MYKVRASMLNKGKINALIERGERFYVCGDGESDVSSGDNPGNNDDYIWDEEIITAYPVPNACTRKGNISL